MLETLREYAADRLTEAGEADIVRGRHFDFFLAVTEEAEAHLWRHEQLEWVARLTIEYDNLRAALAWGIARRSHAAVTLAANLEQYWTLANHWTEGRDWLHRSLAAVAGQAPGPDQARGSMALATLTGNALGLGAGLPVAQAALPLARELGDDAATSRALTYFALWEVYQGNLAQSEQWAREAMQLAEQQNDILLQGDLVLCLGRAALNRGDITEAVRQGERALALYGLAGERTRFLDSLNYLHVAIRNTGDYARALELGRRYLHMARELGTAANIGGGLYILGNMLGLTGDLAQARTLLEEALPLLQDAGSILHWCHVTLSVTTAMQCDAAATKMHSVEAIRLAERLKDHRMQGVTLVFSGIANYYLGDLPRAAELLGHYLSGWRETGGTPRMLMALEALARIRYTLGEYALAEQAVAEGLAACQGIVERRVPLLHIMGLLTLRRAEVAKASEHFHESLQLRAKMGAKRGVAESLEGLGALAARQGNGERAARLLGAAEALREMIGAPIPPPERAEHEQAVATARDLLEGEAFARLWADGRALSWERAAAYALEG
jgi:tetratricopeptide (TPR) repeat protein